jgi:hypothetical protein
MHLAKLPNTSGGQMRCGGSMPIDFEVSKEQLGLRMRAREFGGQIVKHTPVHDVDHGMLRSCFADDVR